MRRLTALLATAALATLAACTETDAPTAKLGPDLGVDHAVGGQTDTVLDTDDSFRIATLETCLPPKVLVCHIPPGNPENAHICRGAGAAVEGGCV
jgi:hypothetical protein